MINEHYYLIKPIGTNLFVTINGLISIICWIIPNLEHTVYIGRYYYCTWCSIAPSLKTVSAKPHLIKIDANAKIDNILISSTQLAVNRRHIPLKSINL